MANPDWFRKTTWTETDRVDFWSHLERSRKTSRCQYLKIQAHHLFATNSHKEIVTALKLINLALTEYPERIFLAELFELKAKCLNKLGNLQEAEKNFILAFNAMRIIPNVKPNAPVSYGLFVIEHKLSRLYPEVLKILNEFIDTNSGLTFPITEYYFYGIQAVILFRNGDFEEAKSFAVMAIIASTKRHSGFNRHPTVGLVILPDVELYKELIKISHERPHGAIKYKLTEYFKKLVR
jgi:tetratricopeptide (TPR) repeat protein